MIDHVLKQDIQNLHTLQEHWKSFHDMIGNSFRVEQLTEQDEADFMLVKSNIAMLHSEFHLLATEDAQTAQNMMSLVARTISLKNLRLLSAAEVKKIEIEWHEVNFLLNDVLGELEDKDLRTDQINPTQFKIKKILASIKDMIIAITGHIVFQLIIGLVVIYFALCAADAFGGDKIKEYWSGYGDLHDKIEDYNILL